MRRAVLWMILFLLIFVPASSKRGEPTIFIDPSMTSQINEIIKKAKPGSTIRFQKGIYKTRNAIYISKKSDLTISANPGVYFILNDIEGAVFSIINSDHIILKGFHAKHRQAARPGEVCSGIVIGIHRSHDIELRDLELNGSGTVGVYISNSVSVFVRDSHIHSNTVSGMTLASFLDHIVVENNHFENNPVDFKVFSLERDQWSKYITLKNNRFDSKVP